MFEKIKNTLRLFYNLFKYNISPSEFFDIKIRSKISNNVRFLGSHKISDSTIEDYTYISMNARISYTHIGKYCSIGPNFLCGWGIHPINGISTSPMFYSTGKQNGFSVCAKTKVEERKQIVIGNDVFIGANVIILDGITVGDGAVIGAGAVVSKDIPPYAVAVGCPIKIVKYRFSADVIEKMLDLKWWDRDKTIHAEIEKNFFNIDNFLSAEF